MLKGIQFLDVAGVASGGEQKYCEQHLFCHKFSQIPQSKQKRRYHRRQVTIISGSNFRSLTVFDGATLCRHHSA
jgi:hypothetical protein